MDSASRQKQPLFKSAGRPRRADRAVKADTLRVEKQIILVYYPGQRASRGRVNAAHDIEATLHNVD